MADAAARPSLGREATPPPPRVLHVITGLETGGAESQLAALAERCHGRGQPLLVVSLIGGGANRARLAAAGVPVIDLGMRRGRVSLGAVSRLAATIRADKPAVIQSWMYHANLLATMALLLSGRWSRTRLFWGLRCSDMDRTRYGAGLRWVIRAGAWLSRFPEAVVVNAESGWRAHQLLGYRPRRLCLIENGIDTTCFKPDPPARAAVRAELAIDEATPLLAHVARIDPMKDHRTLLAALDRLPELAALLIGDGTEALEARPGLYRLGRRDDVPRLLAACDLAVSSSAFGEGFSNAIGEAMAAGLPVVATDVGDSARLIADCGRVVPAGDAGALAAAIGAILAQDPAALGGPARQRIIEHFSIERMVQAYTRLHGV
ncbi:MAG: glycosyltransferase [Alphaproteobacteria bacterium]|nr:glycosyltransferase [Alphaproteobacteria bacterium]MDP6518090.1 glycosyltransferase [Alphaproteobacteria bacterium]